MRVQSLALRFFSLTPARLFHHVRTTPVVGDTMLSVLDALLPKDEFILKRIRSGPLAGMTMEVDPRALDMVIGRYEPVVQAALESLVTQRDVAFDVGANLGYFSLLMARAVGTEGQVICFEPDPVLRRVLIRNLNRNQSVTKDRVVVSGAAAGAESGRAAFTRGWRPTRGKVVGGSGDLQVEVTTLDRAAEAYGIPTVIKIDVEGAELEVLKGAAKLLAEARPTLILEIHTSEAEFECAALLDGFDYKVSRLTSKGTKESFILARG